MRVRPLNRKSTYHGLKGGFLRILMSSNGSYIKNLRKLGHTNVSSTERLLVKFTNDNCIEEDIHLQFRLCTRCSSYFCSHCCNLDQEIIKVLNERTDRYCFFPT